MQELPVQVHFLCMLNENLGLEKPLIKPENSRIFQFVIDIQPFQNVFKSILHVFSFLSLRNFTNVELKQDKEIR